MLQIRWAFLLAALAVWAVPASLSGQGTVVWIAGYPEQRRDGCVWYVARWSDGSFTATPWECGPNGSPARADGLVGAERGYPELYPNGCVWYVTRWRDGDYSAVPFSCPPGVTVTNDGGTLSPSPTLSLPSPTPGLRDGLRYYPLGGTLTIEDVSPPVGTEMAANGRVFISYRHHATGLPEGWRMGYRIWGSCVTRDGRECRDCYLADGLQGSPRFYQPGPSIATWTGPQDAIHTYRRIQICFTILNPETNEARWTNVCDERQAPS
ncbi:MAG: hypothetical protein KatS3mg060_0966 [Dehalococcoidia bacterium]|nr:MAG: hypothetical protein KatS3mg060_0966 [Dehalococcoidia bacterium]